MLLNVLALGNEHYGVFGVFVPEWIFIKKTRVK